MRELRKPEREDILTCPDGHSNQGKEPREWPCMVLGKEVTMKVDAGRYSDRDLLDKYGENAVLGFLYFCSACNSVFGIYYKHQAEIKEEKPARKGRREWVG